MMSSINKIKKKCLEQLSTNKYLYQKISVNEEKIDGLRKVSHRCKYRKIFLGLLFFGVLLSGIICYFYGPFKCLNKKHSYCLNFFKCPLTSDHKDGDTFSRERKIIFKDAVKAIPLIKPRSVEYAPGLIDNNQIVFQESKKSSDNCKPYYAAHTVGRISYQKCVEYQKRYVFPCQESFTPFEGMVRANNCNWNKPDGLIIGGRDATKGEFPHMVLLGYNSEQEWQCAGIIISENFVLTAAHCTYSTNGGYVAKIRTGVWKLSEPVKKNNLYRVKKIYKHDDYNSPEGYNDIALIETDRPMMLNQYAVPACLHDGSAINDTVVIATGWGTTSKHSLIKPKTLQKVELEKYKDHECAPEYSPPQVRHMPKGYDKDTQVCYGDKKTSRDSCKGDSGGPTQVAHPKVECMYLVNSIISHGKHCGVPGSPGIYTRVAPYLNWIEKKVWPQDS